MPVTKFECGNLSSFGEMTSQNFRLKKGMNHRIRIFTTLPPPPPTPPLENGFNFEEK